MTTYDDAAARRRLADAKAALEARRPRIVRRELSLTDKQKREAVEFHRRMMCGLPAELPDWAADLAARGFKFICPGDEDTIRVVRESCPADDTRADALARREKAAGVGAYAKRRRTHGARRKDGIAGRETAAIAH
jgi:hypothetical protein